MIITVTFKGRSEANLNNVWESNFNFELWWTPGNWATQTRSLDLDGHEKQWVKSPNSHNQWWTNKYRERWKIKNEENICVDLHEPSKHWCISKSHKAAELGITLLRQGGINCVRWDGKVYLRRRAFRMLLRNDSGCVLPEKIPEPESANKMNAK